MPQPAQAPAAGTAGSAGGGILPRSPSGKAKESEGRTPPACIMLAPPDRWCCRPHIRTSPRCISPNTLAEARGYPGALSLPQAGLGTERSLTDNRQKPRWLSDGSFGLPLTEARQPHGAPGVPCAAHASPSSLVLPARPASPPAPLSWQLPEARRWHFTPSPAFWVRRV